ncbi:MAG: hypothetical protein ACYDG2_06860 [Ruminiclostridium sp.]
MARGKSGRIVLEVDPALKRKLYLVLEQNQTTLKYWFLESADIYINENSSRKFSDLQLVAEDDSTYYAQVKK